MQRVFLCLPWPVTDKVNAGATGSRTIPALHPARRRCRQALFKMMAWLALLLSILISFSAPVSAQSVTRLYGRVFDALDGHPVAGAAVTLSGTGYSSITDASGGYQFDHTPEGWYRVCVNAVGYDSACVADMHLTIDITRSLDIHLDPMPIQIPGMTVHSPAVNSTGSDVTVISREQIEAAQPVDLPDLLEDVPGVTVRRSGNGSGGVRLSIRGSASRHVLVLVDGHPINGSGDGEADLSAIPVTSVQRVEVYKGSGPVQAGPGGLGGTINIVTTAGGDRSERILSFGHAGGSYDNQNNELVIEQLLPVDSLKTSLSYQEERSQGDYPYSYTAAPSDRVFSGVARQNNDFESQSFHAAATYRPTSFREIAFTGQSYDSERGLPGRASSPVLSARAKDDRLLLNGAWRESRGERHQFEARVGYSKYTQRFSDPGDPLVFRAAYDTEYRNRILSGDLVYRLIPWTGNTIRLGGQFRNERLETADLLADDEDAVKTRRAGHGVFTAIGQEVALPSLPLFERLAGEMSIRYDDVTSTSDPQTLADSQIVQTTHSWSPSVSASLSGGQAVRVTLRSSYGKSISLPSLNSLFWQGSARSSGNPRLKPERSEHSDVGVEISTRWFGVSVMASMTYYHTFYYDLVQWQPDFRGVWKPLNLAGARVTGHEDQVTFGFLRDQILLVYQNTIAHALNRVPGQNSYGKQLTYTPGYQTSASLRLNHRIVQAAYSIRWVDRRYATSSNTWWYDEYRLDDIRFGLRVPWRHWRFDVDYRADNLRSVDYTLITHHPMPPREWRLAAGVHYTF